MSIIPSVQRTLRHTPDGPPVGFAEALGFPDALTLRPAASLAAWGRTLVVAPHPDDESLGCGGLIAHLRHLGVSVEVLFVTDGAGSHLNSPSHPPPVLQRLREDEARAALNALGVARTHAHFLALPDGALPHPGDVLFDAAAQAVADALAERAPETLAIPWRRDPHRDHRATWHLVQAGLRQASVTPRQVEYPIWSWVRATADDLPRPGEVEAWRLDVETVLPQKRAAIAAHRSQTTPLITDASDGFVLAPEILALFDEPYEVYFDVR